MKELFSTDLPFVTAALPGIGGEIKAAPEDFVVEEIAAYEPCGAGDHLYLWIEKRDMGAEYFTRQVAQRLGIGPMDVGMAGMKDRRAVTRQWISVPSESESRLQQLDGPDLKVLNVSRHGNKLKPGHLRGNRFAIRVRGVLPDAGARLEAVLEHLRMLGLPNFYGEQRFGREGETLDLGLRLLRREQVPAAMQRKKFLRKLALSAVQSALFNAYLTQRLADGLLRTVLLGDVLAKWPAGGMFTCTDVAVDQERFENREIIPAGPMFGVKTFPTADDALQRETHLLEAAGLKPESFAGFGKLLQGTRRFNLVYVDDLAGRMEGTDAFLSFSLPSGSYATVLLREIMKTESPAQATVSRNLDHSQ